MDDRELHVIFGTGPVGMAVMEELVAKGKQVKMVNRSGKAEVPESVELTKGDAGAPESVRRICQGASVVYNCTNALYHKWAELLAPLYKGVLEGAASAGAKLVVMDNLYMYGSTQGKSMVETLPYAATTRKGRIRAELADYLMEAHQSGKVQVTIGRASDFFGPRVLSSAMGERVFYPALQGKSVQLVGKLDLPHSYSFIRDVARGLVMLAEHEEAFGQTWHLPNTETVTSRQFIDLLSKEIGRTIKIQTAPSWLLTMMGWFDPIIRELPEMLYQFEEPFIMDDTKFTQAFGEQATSLKTAIQETLTWFREHPQR